MYCDLTLDVGQIQSIMHQVFLDCCRNDRAKREIAGLGVAMTAEASTSHDCGKQGPYARSYVKSKRKNRTKSSGAREAERQKRYLKQAGSKSTAGQNRYSVHKNTSHNGEEYNKRKKAHLRQQGRAADRFV